MVKTAWVPRPLRWGSRRVALGLCVCLAGACGRSGADHDPPGSRSSRTTVTSTLSASAPVSATILSADGSDTYTVANINGTVRATAPGSNAHSNLREVFWPTAARDATDAESCAEWASQTPGSLTQQGAALRVRTAAGVTRAVTVTKNVWGAQVWAFNFHVWDSSKTPPTQGFGSFDLATVFSPGGPYFHTIALPWHLCARTIQGRLQFKAWPGSETEPAWGDSRHGGSAPIPAGWEAPGKAGWYVGHLSPNASADFTHLETRDLDPAGVQRSATSGPS